MKDRQTPYKSVGRRTVVGLAEHKTKMALKDKEIADLKAKLATAPSEYTTEWLKAENRRMELIINKLIGYVE